VLRITCIVLCCVHLLTLAVCTYLAAWEIRSILTTGCICSLTGGACGIAGRRCGRPEIAVGGFLTIGVAITLFLLESLFLNLGADRALYPFCIVFFINSLISTLTILVGIRLLLAPAESLKLQLSLGSLLVSMITFAIFCGIAKQTITWDQNGLMAIDLGLLGVCVVGLSTTLFMSLYEANRRRKAA
jgi:hypothetical protein